MAGSEGEKIGDAYVEVHIDTDKAMSSAAKDIERQSSSISKASEKVGKDSGKGYIKGSLAGMDAGSDQVVKRSGEIGQKSGQKTVDEEVKELQRGKPKVTLAGAAMMGGLPIAAMAAGAGIAAGLAGVPLIFAGIAAVADSSNTQVQDSYKALSDDVVASVKGFAAPLSGTFIQVADDAKATFDKLKPQLKSIFSDLAPDVMHLANGINALALNAFPGLTAAAAASEPVFAGLESLLAQTGKGVGDFFTNISKGSASSGKILTDTGHIVQNFLGFAGNLFANIANVGAPVFHQFAGLLDQVEGAVSGLAAGALPVLAATSSTTIGAFAGILKILTPIAPALGNVTATALTAKFGFSALNMVSFGNLSKSLDGVKLKVSAAQGPMGKLNAAAGGLGSAAGIAGVASLGFGLIMDAVSESEQKAAARAAQLQDATQNLSKALEDGATVSGTTYAQALAKAAAENFGMNQAVISAGSNLSTLVSKLQEGGSAWDNYSSSLKATGKNSSEAFVNGIVLQDGLKNLKTVSDQAAEANTQHDLSLRGIASTGMPMVDAAVLQLVQSNGDLDAKQVAASTSAEQLNGAFDTLRSSTAEVSDKVKALQTVMDQFTGRTPTVEEATQALNGDIRNISQATKDWTTNTAGSQVALDRHGMSLAAFATSMINADGTINTATQTGSDFQDMLVQTQTDLYNDVTAMHASGASHVDLTKKVQATRDAFIAQATKMGFTQTQAVALANKYGLIPDKVATTVEGHAQSALGAIGSVTSALHRLPASKTVTITMREVVAGVKGLFGLPAFAGGTDSAPGGVALVGEKGPELVSLPRGSQVLTHSKTQQVMSGMGPPLASVSATTPSTFGVPSSPSAVTGGNVTVTMNLYQQPGEDMAAFANKVAAALETKMRRA